MELDQSDKVINLFRELIVSFPPKVKFPLEHEIGIPTSVERRLLARLQIMPLPSLDELAEIRSKLSYVTAYRLVTFAVRSAILAARTNDPDILRAGLIGVTLDNDVVDYRDVLSAFSIIENCATRVGVDFAAEIRSISRLATDKRRSTIEAYLSRTPQMRSVHTLGFEETTGKDGLTFARRRDLFP